MSVYSVDSRHDSVAGTDRMGRDRFPSLHLNTENFVRIGWNDQMPPEECKLTCLERLRLWISGISRKVWFILIAVFIAGISILTVGLILIFALPHSSEKGGYNNNVTPSTSSSSPPTSPTPSPIPYPKGYPTGMREVFYPSGEVDTLLPEMRGYSFQNRLLAYGENNTYVIVNDSKGIFFPAVVEPEGCDGCMLISLPEDCFLANNCTTEEAIFCCQHCQQEKQVCLVRNTAFQFSGDIIDWEISSDGEQLQITTMSELDKNITAFQVDRVNETGLVHSGPIVPYLIPSDVSQPASITVDPNYGSVPDLVAWVAPNGTLVYDYQGRTSSVDLEIQGIVLSVGTTVDGHHALIALLQSNKFYAVRVNLRNRCASTLPQPQKFLFAGSFRGSFWAENHFFLWYLDQRATVGVSVIRYSFSWPDDETCPYSP